MAYTYLSDQQEASFQAWLSTASDDDRLMCFACWYWDLGGAIEQLQAMVDRADCDVTTALTIFWLSEPTSFARVSECGTRARGVGAHYALQASISRRYRAGEYRHSGLAFDPAEFGASQFALERMAGHPDLAIPPGMAAPLVGRKRVYTTKFAMYGIPAYIENMA